MASSDSISAARDRLNLSIDAVYSLSQIISLSQFSHLGFADDLACVFGYIAQHLSDDKCALEELLEEKVSPTVTLVESANG